MIIVKYGRDGVTLMPVNLGFFEGGEKTEKATPRKKEKAREEGQVAKSNEVGVAFLFIAMFTALRMFSGYILNGIASIFNACFNMIASYDEYMLPVKISGVIANMFLQVVLITLPLMLVALVIGLIINLAQVGWKPTPKTLMPKFSKLSPIKGIKRLFSMRSLLELVKSLAKLGIILYVIYSGLRREYPMLSKFVDLGLGQGAAYIANVIISLGINVGVVYIAIAAVDYAYARYKHSKDLRMSKQEIKEEYKETEGNPQIKGAIRRRMREASMRRMMSEVPKADVIITNPTHYAVALKYEMENDTNGRRAPVVIAKGVDFLAARIKKTAIEHGVMIVENKPLAQALYASVDIGREIPEELYTAVAEILAYVYKVKKAG